MLNPSGDGTPYALKMMACLLLSEITMFMRDVYPNLPKSRGRNAGHNSSGRNRRDTDSDVTLTTGDRSDALRRGSSKDDSSMTTLDSAALGERKISFAVDDEDTNSLSSHSIVSGTDSRFGMGGGASGADKCKLFCNDKLFVFRPKHGWKVLKLTIRFLKSFAMDRPCITPSP